MKDHKQSDWYDNFFFFSDTTNCRSDEKLPLENTRETGCEGSWTPSVSLYVNVFPECRPLIIAFVDLLFL